MTVSSEDYKDVYTGNASAVTPYTGNFKILDESHVEVIKQLKTTLAEEILVLNSDYTITGVGGSSFSVVTGGGAIAATYNVVIRRSAPYTQLYDPELSGAFNSETLEQSMDKLLMLIQQIKEVTDRSVVRTSEQTSTLALPVPEAGKYLKWNTGETALENDALDSTTTSYDGTITQGLDSAKAASPEAGDIHVALDTQVLYRCVTNGAWDYDQRINALEVMGTITGSGAAVIGGTLNVGGAITASGAVVIEGTLELASGTTVNELSIDGTLAGDSDDALPTEKAVKLYVDTNIRNIGASASRSDNTAYQASTDGFFIGVITAGASVSAGRIIGYSDASATPTTVKGQASVHVNTGGSAQSAYSNVNSFCIPVNSGDYYKGVHTNTGNNPTVSYYWASLA